MVHGLLLRCCRVLGQGSQNWFCIQARMPASNAFRPAGPDVKRGSALGKQGGLHGACLGNTALTLSCFKPGPTYRCGQPLCV